MDSYRIDKEKQKTSTTQNTESLGDCVGSRRDTKKLLGKGAIVAVAGGISNVSWFTAMAANRALESTNSSTLWTSIGFGAGSTLIEYAMATFATSGDVDVSWNPKSKVGKITKKVFSKAPLLVTAWRGAASGVVLDEISGRKVTSRRKLAHAGLYGGIMAGWVSKPGSLAFEGIGTLGHEAIEKPITSVGILAAVATGVYFANKSVDSEALNIQQQQDINHMIVPDVKRD
jgi:hypothetical protein